MSNVNAFSLKLNIIVQIKLCLRLLQFDKQNTRKFKFHEKNFMFEFLFYSQSYLNKSFLSKQELKCLYL